MGLLDNLSQILAGAASPDPNHVDQFSRQAPKDDLGRGVADALRSDQTPSLGETLEKAVRPGHAPSSAPTSSTC